MEVFLPTPCKEFDRRLYSSLEITSLNHIITIGISRISLGRSDRRTKGYFNLTASEAAPSPLDFGQPPKKLFSRRFRLFQENFKNYIETMFGLGKFFHFFFFLHVGFGDEPNST